MGQVKTKKEIVKMLLKNKELENEDESQLMEILFNEPIAIDVDKQAEENETWKDKLADRITEKAGSWGFIIGFIIFMIPFFKIVLKMMEYALSHLNNYNYDKMILILITMLSLLIAFFAGHILSAPAVSIYFGITIILYMNIDKETL